MGRAKRLWWITKAVVKAVWPLAAINVLTALISHAGNIDKVSTVLLQALGNILYVANEEWKK